MSLNQPGPSGTKPIIVVDSPTPEDLALRAEIGEAVADAAAKLPKRLSDVFTCYSMLGALDSRDCRRNINQHSQAAASRPNQGAVSRRRYRTAAIRFGGKA